MVFKSSNLEKKFQREGYLVLPLLSKDEVETLLDFFKQRYKIDFSGFHSTHFLKDKKLKKEVHDKIAILFQTHLDNYLSDYQAIFGNFMVKAVGDGSRMPLHADWTYVDEDWFQSLGVWCPLVDTNEENGRLGVVPKSHLLKRNYRGPQIPTPFHDHNEYIIDKFGKLLTMSAGEVVIYDHRTLHFSPANKSTTVRPAINLVMAPKSADLYHFTNIGAYPEIAKYSPRSSDFYINYTHFQEPDNLDFMHNTKEEWQMFSKRYLDKILKVTTIDRLKALFSL